MVAFQKVFISLTPELEQTSDGKQFVDRIQAIQHLWLIYLPGLIAGGLSFGIAGIFIIRGSFLARRIAQATAICGYVWLIAYLISGYNVVDSMLPGQFPEIAVPVIGWIFKTAAVLITLFMAALLTAMVFVLNQVPNRGSD